eukprot:gene10847-11825_t
MTDDIEKFPYGLKGLAEEINALGCKFGLWFEPEMVSEESMLFTSHPDWYLHVPGRPRQIGRNQLVLDLSRQDVRDHIFSALSAVLSSANIEYVKWDMNRPLTEVYSIAAGSGEASLAAWMYVSRDKSEAIAFAYSTNADHWNNIVPRLPLMGLIAEAEYEVVEPAPNDIMQVAGTYMMIETEVPVYQLGVSSVVLTGEILMSAGLPVRFYTLDDAAVFLLKRVN